jgi:MFS family permease
VNLAARRAAERLGMASIRAALSAYLRLARNNRNFRRLWFAQIVSEIGDWFYVVAIYSLLLELTGRASSVALALVLQVLPQTFFGPIAGVINDRLRRKQVMIFADLARALIVAAMILVRSRSLVWLIYPLLFTETIMWAIFEPARSAVLPNVAAEQDLIVANTLSTTTWSCNLAVGSLFGGLVAAFLGREVVFILNSASFLCSAALLAGMNFHEAHVDRHGPLRLRDLFNYTPILDGFRYVRGDARLFATILVKGGAMILGVNWVLFPIMGERIFTLAGHGLSHTRAAMFTMSLLMGSRGVGALLGPLLFTPWAGQDHVRLRNLILLGFVMGGIGYSLLGLAPGLALACLAVMFAHMGGSNVWVASTTLLQLTTEDRFRGRVFSADLGFAMLILGSSAWSGGQLIDYGLSPRALAIAAGVTILLPALAWWWAQRLWTPERAASAF